MRNSDSIDADINRSRWAGVASAMARHHLVLAVAGLRITRFTPRDFPVPAHSGVARSMTSGLGHAGLEPVRNTAGPGEPKTIDHRSSGAAREIEVRGSAPFTGRLPGRSGASATGLAPRRLGIAFRVSGGQVEPLAKGFGAPGVVATETVRETKRAGATGLTWAQAAPIRMLPAPPARHIHDGQPDGKTKAGDVEARVGQAAPKMPRYVRKTRPQPEIGHSHALRGQAAAMLGRPASQAINDMVSQLSSYRNTPNGNVASNRGTEGRVAPIAARFDGAPNTGGADIGVRSGGTGGVRGMLGSQPGLQSAGDAPARSAAGASGGPTEGDVYLDGTLMGRWMTRTLTSAASRPPSGGAAFDATRARLPIGAMIGA